MLEQLLFILGIQGAQVQLEYFLGGKSPDLLGEVLFGQPFYEDFGRGSICRRCWFGVGSPPPKVFDNRNLKY